MMKTDWIKIIAVAIVIASGISMIQIYYNEKNMSCHSNPLVYAAQQYEESTGVEFRGSGSFVHDKSPIIYFTKYGLEIDNPHDQNVNPDFLKGINITMIDPSP